MFKDFGSLLITLGISAIFLGIAYKLGLLNWFGKLPGDIKVDNENSSFYFPITTMIVVSVILTIIVNLLFRRY